MRIQNMKYPYVPNWVFLAQKWPIYGEGAEWKWLQQKHIKILSLLLRIYLFRCAGKLNSTKIAMNVA